jgi:RimJ/RimL family protein N-acetyltransferase
MTFSDLLLSEIGEAHGRDIAIPSSIQFTYGMTFAVSVGSTLVEALFLRAIALSKHVMIGGVDATNEASIRFHERLGFERVAYFREVGHKFGRWLDLVFMQRFLDAPGAPRK